MNLNPFFKSIIEQDRCPVVICDLNHTIIYMNAAAIENYVNYGGSKILGKSLLDCHNTNSCEMIEKIVSWFKESESNNRIYTGNNEKQNKDIYMIALRDDEQKLIGYYEQHIHRNKEEMKVYDFS